MLGLPHGTKIYVCSQPVDFRKGFDGLRGLVESVFEMNVLDGHLFLFVNRRGDRIQALWWEPGGLILWYSAWSAGPKRGLGPRKVRRMSRSTPRNWPCRSEASPWHRRAAGGSGGPGRGISKCL